jgi:hypothetical protein
MEPDTPNTRDDSPALFVSENLWVELTDEEILADLLYPATKV